MEMGCFVVGFGVILSVSLGREYLDFVRRGGSNGMSVILGFFEVSEWILWRVSCGELLYRYGENVNKL